MLVKAQPRLVRARLATQAMTLRDARELGVPPMTIAVGREGYVRNINEQIEGFTQKARRQRVTFHLLQRGR